MFDLNLVYAVFVMHFIADFPLQGDFLGVYKAKYDFLLFVHCVIWSGCIAAVLAYFGAFAWWKVAWLFAGHFFFDRLKCRKKDKDNQYTIDLWVDQALHLFQLFFVVLPKGG